MSPSRVALIPLCTHDPQPLRYSNRPFDQITQLELAHPSEVHRDSALPRAHDPLAIQPECMHCPPSMERKIEISQGEKTPWAGWSISQRIFSKSPYALSQDLRGHASCEKSSSRTDPWVRLVHLSGSIGSPFSGPSMVAIHSRASWVFFSLFSTHFYKALLFRSSQERWKDRARIDDC
jgi:hypothetical protein